MIEKNMIRIWLPEGKIFKFEGVRAASRRHIMENTDLVDINGNEIYEGDFLKFDPPLETFLPDITNNWAHVWSYDKATGLIFSFNHSYSENSLIYLDLLAKHHKVFPNDALGYEIVGNVYETPDE